MWKTITKKIFISVVIIGIFGIFNTLYDFISTGVAVVDFAISFLPFATSLSRSIHSFTAIIGGIGLFSKFAYVGGYVFYFIGLKQLASILEGNDREQILNVRKVSILLFVCAICSFLAKIPILGLIISIVIWVVTLVNYIKLKSYFTVLKGSASFDAGVRGGFEKLRRAAVNNIRLMIMPFVIIIMLILCMILLAASSGFYIESTLDLVVMIMIIPTVTTIIFMLFAFFYPIIGWNAIMNGSLLDEKHDENIHVSNIPNSIERPAGRVLRQCPMCGEMIDGDVEICPICCEETNFNKKTIEKQNVYEAEKIEEPEAEKKISYDDAVVDNSEPQKEEESQPVVEPVVDIAEPAKYDKEVKKEEFIENIPQAEAEPKRRPNKKSIMICILLVLIVAAISYFTFQKHENNTVEKEDTQNTELLLKDINRRINKASIKSDKGMMKEDDKYEDYLMEAYSEFIDIEKEIRENQNLGIDPSDIMERISNLRHALETAKNELNEKSEGLAEADEESLSEEFRVRAKKIEDFLENNKNE